MKRDEEITQLVQNLSIDDCIELFRDICMKDLEMTKQAVKMGYDPLSIDTCYFAGFAGRLYLEEGFEGLKKLDYLSEDALRRILTRTLICQNDVADIIEESKKRDRNDDEELRAVIGFRHDIPRLKRKTFRLVENESFDQI